jgi:hypothetical protein
MSASGGRSGSLTEVARERVAGNMARLACRGNREHEQMIESTPAQIKYLGSQLLGPVTTAGVDEPEDRTPPARSSRLSFRHSA